jgi:uncharacterized membrane protein HdeD (DUF308 family)
VAGIATDQEVDGMIAIIGSWRALAGRGVVAILFGVLALVWPGITLHALVLLFGAFALVDGAMMVAAGLTGARDPQGRHLPLVLQGLLGVAVGIVTFVWPGITALALLLLIAAWAFMTGTLAVGAAIRLRRVIENEWLLAASGGLSVLFAVALVVSPRSGALAVTWLIGIYALVYGVFLVGLSRRLHQLEAARGERRTNGGRRQATA